MLSLVSTWMGDRLGTLGAVGFTILFAFLLFHISQKIDNTDGGSGIQNNLNLKFYSNSYHKVTC